MLPNTMRNPPAPSAHIRNGSPRKTNGHSPITVKTVPTNSPNCRSSLRVAAWAMVPFPLPLVEREFFLPIRIPFKGFLLLFPQHIILDDEEIYLRPHKTAIGILWRAHNGFAAHVERGIHTGAIARLGLECLQQLVVARVRVLMDRLNSS